MKSTIRITPDGQIVAIKTRVVDHLPLDTFGQVATRRASHILPGHPGKRLAFRLLRRLAGERGPIAEWTRRWRGPWQVTWADQPHLVVFAHPSRRVCVEWEIQNLNQRLQNESHHLH